MENERQSLGRLVSVILLILNCFLNTKTLRYKQEANK